MTFQKIKEKYLRESAEYARQTDELETEIEKLEEEIEKLKKAKNNLKFPYWIEKLIKPLVKEIVEKESSFKSFDIRGPFGLRSYVFIVFSENEEVSEHYDENEYYLSIVPKDLDTGKLNYETGETINKFSNGSLGEINGMNNVTKPLPENIEEIIELIFELNK